MRSNWFDRNGRVAQVLDVRGLGADAIVDYTKGEPLPEVDAVFDTLGTTEQASIRATKRGGTVVGVAGLPDGEFARAWLPAFARPVIWLGPFGRRRAAAKAGVTFRYLFMRPDGVQLAELASWIEAGALRPIRLDRDRLLGRPG